jgi:outer membrane protein assembly factor BamB
LDQATQRLKVLGVLRGHYHQTYFYYSDKTHIPVICSSPIREDQAGVFTKQPRLIHFSGDKLTSRIIPLGQEQRAIIVWPQPGAVISNTVPLTILINAYNSGSLVKKVSYTLGGPAGEAGADQPLTQKTWWSWRDEIPAGQLAPGDYVLSVRATDDQGQTWTRTSHFTISSRAPEAAKLGGNWVSYYGPDGRDRVTTDTPSPHLRLAWAAPVGSAESGRVSYGNPLVRDGVVYAPVRDDNVGWPQGGIVAFDALTGQRRWKASIGSVWHSPAILGDRLYAISSQGMVHAIDLTTHKVIWTYDVYQDQGFSHRLATAPVAAGPDCVIVGADNCKFVCLDAASGKPRWTFKIGNVAGMVAGAFVDGDVVYLADQESLYALNLKDGSVIWKHKLGYRQRVFGSPFVKDGRLYLNQHGRISAFDVTQGCRRLWNIGSENYKFTMPVVRDGRVYASDAAGLFSRSAKDGSELWRIATDVKTYMDHNKYQQVIDASSHALAGSYDFVGSDNGCFYVIDLKSGRPVSEFFIGPPIKSSPAISGNMVFVGSTDGNLYAFAPALPAPATQPVKSVSGSTAKADGHPG